MNTPKESERKAAVERKRPKRRKTDLTGRWLYREDYGYGVTEGELYLRQEGDRLSGRLVFTDRIEDEEPYMIQEFLEGTLEGKKVRIEAVEYDIIHAEHRIDYELDSWFGVLLDESTIKGVSRDDQGVEGCFEFIKTDKPLPAGL